MPLRVILRKAWIWGPLLAYLALIYHLSGLSRVPWAAAYPDYLEHACEYFGLSVLMARAFNDGLLRPVALRILVLSFLLCVAYAVSDEIHQMFVPDRFADYRDVLSDAFGAGLGLLVVRLAGRLRSPSGTS